MKKKFTLILAMSIFLGTSAPVFADEVENTQNTIAETKICMKTRSNNYVLQIFIQT